MRHIWVFAGLLMATIAVGVFRCSESPVDPPQTPPPFPTDNPVVERAGDFDVPVHEPQRAAMKSSPPLSTSRPDTDHETGEQNLPVDDVDTGHTLGAAYQQLVNRLTAATGLYESKTRDGCYTPVYYLVEMQLEERNEDWAVRAETGFRELVKDYDARNAQVAIRCHSTLCRIVVFWHEMPAAYAIAEFGQLLYPAFARSALSAQFDQVGSTHHGGFDGYYLSVWLFRSKARDWGDETESCPYLGQDETKSFTSTAAGLVYAVRGRYDSGAARISGAAGAARISLW